MRNRLILAIAASSLALPVFAADPIYQNWHALRGQAAPPVAAAVRLPTFKGPVTVLDGRSTCKGMHKISLIQFLFF